MAVTTPALMAAEFRAKAQAAGGQVGTAVVATAALIQRGARQNAPVDTGFLRSSITRETSRTPFGAEAVIGPEAHYGGYVENGTRYQAPQPYLLPAALDAEPWFEKALENVVGFDVTPTFGVSTSLPSLFGADMQMVEV
jgi:HK97 gp10 family phage protein